MEPFNYVKDVFGGTEYMGRGWHKHIASYVPKFKEYNSYIIPGNTPGFRELTNSDKEMIVWMHNTPQQFEGNALEVLRHPGFLGKVKYFVVPSEAHKKLILEDLPVEPECIYVIPNAIEPLNYNPDKFKEPKQIKIIHTSSYDRGFTVLMNSMNFIKDDFRLEVYNNFYPDLVPGSVIDPRVRCYGKTPKDTVREAIEFSHIHAYPSIYPETFCISQVEAMSAGLLCVTTDYGALPEVSGGKTMMYPYIEDHMEHMKVFAGHLSSAIEQVRSGKWDPTEQIEYVNKTYSWEAIKNKWMEFHELI